MQGLYRLAPAFFLMGTLNMSSAMSIIVSFTEFLLDFQELCLQGFHIIRKFLALLRFNYYRPWFHYSLSHYRNFWIILCKVSNPSFYCML